MERTISNRRAAERSKEPGIASVLKSRFAIGHGSGKNETIACSGGLSLSFFFFFSLCSFLSLGAPVPLGRGPLSGAFGFNLPEQGHTRLNAPGLDTPWRNSTSVAEVWERFENSGLRWSHFITSRGLAGASDAASEPTAARSAGRGSEVWRGPGLLGSTGRLASLPASTLILFEMCPPSECFRFLLGSAPSTGRESAGLGAGGVGRFKTTLNAPDIAPRREQTLASRVQKKLVALASGALV